MENHDQTPPPARVRSGALGSATTPKLIRCPFCGGQAGFAFVRYDAGTVKTNGWDQSEFHFVNCMHCNVDNKGLVGHATPAKAAERWNNRQEQAAEVFEIGLRIMANELRDPDKFATDEQIAKHYLVKGRLASAVDQSQNTASSDGAQ